MKTANFLNLVRPHGDLSFCLYQNVLYMMGKGHFIDYIFDNVVFLYDLKSKQTITYFDQLEFNQLIDKKIIILNPPKGRILAEVL